MTGERRADDLCVNGQATLALVIGSVVVVPLLAPALASRVWPLVLPGAGLAAAFACAVGIWLVDWLPAGRPVSNGYDGFTCAAVVSDASLGNVTGNLGLVALLLVAC